MASVDVESNRPASNQLVHVEPNQATSNQTGGRRPALGLVVTNIGGWRRVGRMKSVAVKFHGLPSKYIYRRRPALELIVTNGERLAKRSRECCVVPAGHTRACP